MLKTRTIFHCAYKALHDTIYHDGIEHAGYLAFLAILSIFPFLVFFFAIAGFIGDSDIGLKFMNTILHNDIIPSSALEALQPRIEEIASGPPQGLLTLAIIGAIWTSSSAVEGLRTILNRAYRVATPPAYILRRLLSIGQFVVMTAILIAATFLLVIAPNIWQNIHHLLHLARLKEIVGITDVTETPVMIYLRYTITTFIMFGFVMTTYLTIPNIKQTWRAVAPGAMIVVALWFLAGSLLSGYVSNFKQVNILYGSLGGFIAALLFFYITAMIFIYGAEFNHNLEKAMGHRILPKAPTTPPHKK